MQKASHKEIPTRSRCPGTIGGARLRVIEPVGSGVIGEKRGVARLLSPRFSSTASVAHLGKRGIHRIDRESTSNRRARDASRAWAIAASSPRNLLDLGRYGGAFAGRGGATAEISPGARASVPRRLLVEYDAVECGARISAWRTMTSSRRSPSAERTTDPPPALERIERLDHRGQGRGVVPEVDDHGRVPRFEHVEPPGCDFRRRYRTNLQPGRGWSRGARPEPSPRRRPPGRSRPGSQPARRASTARAPSVDERLRGRALGQHDRPVVHEGDPLPLGAMPVDHRVSPSRAK